MRTIEIKLYKFNELTAEAKKKALETGVFFNLSYNWWEWVYDDAKNIGIKIHEFDVDMEFIETQFMDSCYLVAKKILECHGEQAETYKIATRFNLDWDNLVKEYSDGELIDVVSEGNGGLFDIEADKLEDEFERNISQCYLSILNSEYEYLSSDECAKEMLIDNDYDFTENGDLYE